MISAKRAGIVLIGLAVVFSLVATGCQKKAAESPTSEFQKAVNEYEGVVNAALGRYMYVSTAQGFDIVLPGFDAASLVGKTVRVKGNLMIEHPSLFLADSVEVKQDGSYSSVYTRSQEFQVEDFVELKTREGVPAINISGINKPEEWEGKGLVKVYGKIQRGEGGTAILILDDKGREMARIIVDSMTTYAEYYLKKLRLFDKFWFYLNVKESVDRRVRTKTKEIFHADVVIVGLY